MHNVSDILRRKSSAVISVSIETPVLEALKVMADRNIGSVVVMEKRQYRGIMTERDYARKVALKGRASTALSVSEIMSTHLPAVAPKDTISHCMELMSEINERYLPVFVEDEMVGIISMSDVIDETLIMQRATIDHLSNYISGQVS